MEFVKAILNADLPHHSPSPFSRSPKPNSSLSMSPVGHFLRPLLYLCER